MELTSTNNSFIGSCWHCMTLNGKIPLLSTTPPELADLLSSWLLSFRAAQRSGKTLQTCSEGVRAFLKWCDQTGTPPELTRQAVTEFVADILDRGAQPNTATGLLVSQQRGSTADALRGPGSGLGNPAHNRSADTGGRC